MPHRLPDENVMTPGLLRYAIKEAQEDGGDGRHFLVMALADRRVIVHAYSAPNLPPEQMMFAADMLKRLNDELHYDGAWFFLFTHPTPIVDPEHATVTWTYARMLIEWMDADGDPKMAIEWVKDGNSEELDFVDVLAQGPDPWIEKCEGAFQQQRLIAEALETRPGETYKRAQGEIAPSLKH